MSLPNHDEERTYRTNVLAPQLKAKIVVVDTQHYNLSVVSGWRIRVLAKISLKPLFTLYG